MNEKFDITAAGATVPVFSEEDLELISALQIAPRMSWTQAGEVLDRHPTTLAGRWARLRGSGSAWVTAHILGDPREMAVTFHDIRCEPGRRRDVVEALCSIEDIASVEECSRQKDFMLTVFSPSPDWLHKQLTPQLDRIPGLLQHEASYSTELHYGAFEWRIGGLSRSQTDRLRAIAGPRPYSPAPLPADFADIVQVLCRDGRATAAEISIATGLPATTARRRLQRILKSGALVFRCDIAQGLAGFPLACQWHARLPVEQHREAAQVLRRAGALRLCASITGQSNFMFMFWLRNPAEIMDLERTLALRLPELEIRESTMITHIAKRMGWRLGNDGTATGEIQSPGTSWNVPRTKKASVTANPNGLPI